MNAPTFLLDGLKAGWPICLGFVPIGLALGVLAQKAGLHPLEVGFMSVVVFAGSSQFIAVSMISGGASALSIILTTFVVNLRHLLMSSALSVFLKGQGRLKLTFFAYGVTDESFAVNMGRFRQKEGWDFCRALTVNQSSNLVWIASTTLGAYGGQYIPASAFGIDYALVAMFICLLVFQLRGRLYAVTGIVAGLLAVGFSIWIPGNLYVVLASVAAATIGLTVRRKKVKEGRG